jgi:hypothetical protein
MKKWPEIKQSIQGKVAMIRWYQQPIYPGVHQNRLVELWVGNEQLISRGRTQNDVTRGSKFPLWLAIFYWSGIISQDIYCRRLLTFQYPTVSAVGLP